MVRNAKLVGQAIIAYLQQKGYPEVSGVVGSGGAGGGGVRRWVYCILYIYHVCLQGRCTVGL